MKIPTYILKIEELTTLNIAVTSDEGDKVHQKIEDFLNKVDVLTLDFKNIELMTTAFLNAAIGQLYKDHKSEELNRRLKILNMDPSDIVLLKKVNERAKEYYKDPETFGDITDNFLRNE